MDNCNVYGLRYYWICQEVSGSVLAKTLELLFKGGKPIEKNLESKISQKNLNEGERYTLEQLKDGNKNLHDLDVCLLFRLIQRTCGLASPQHNVWYNSKYRINKRVMLEHYLFRIKELRNEAVHEFRFLLRNMSSREFEDRKKEVETLLNKIINKVCLKKNLSPDEMSRWKTQMLNNLQEISLEVTIGSIGTQPQPRQGDRVLLREDSVDGIIVPNIDTGLQWLIAETNGESQELDDDAYIAAWNANLPPKSTREIISEWTYHMATSWGIEVIGIALVWYYLLKK